MDSYQQIRQYVRQVIKESINNFLDKEPATETKQLDDNSATQVLGDALHVKLSQMANELGSDGANAPTFAVKAGKP